MSSEVDGNAEDPSSRGRRRTSITDFQMARIWAIERYFIRQILIWLLLSTLGLVVIFFITQIVRVGPVFAGSDASFAETLGALGLVLVPILGWALTPAFSVAVFAVVGRMASDSELTALDSAGVGRWKLWAGPLFLTFVLFLVSGWVWLDLAPRSQGELRRVAIDLAGRALLGRIEPGRFSKPVRGITFFSDSQTDDGVFGGVFIEDATDDEHTMRLVVKDAVLKADSASQSLKANLGEGTGFITFRDGERPASALSFESLEFNIPLGAELNQTLEFLPVSLSSTTAELLLPPPKGQDGKRWSYRLWTRIAAPFGFLAIAILSIGLALGFAISRKGLAIAVSAILFLTYHLLGRFGESLLDMNMLGPAVAALAPAILISVIGSMVILGSNVNK